MRYGTHIKEGYLLQRMYSYRISNFEPIIGEIRCPPLV